MTSGTSLNDVVGNCPPTALTLNATPPARSSCPDPDDFGCALGQSLGFFDAQRSGRLPDAAIPWRGDSLLQDIAPNGAPLVGGWCVRASG